MRQSRRSEGNVTFRWRDSAHGNKKRLMTLPVEEFLRRFLLHLPPRGFMRCGSPQCKTYRESDRSRGARPSDVANRQVRTF